ncbi:hypothetical protein Rs2_37829 [Raphanus sativus]|nr:hypothetical protein Rs2_37829 [Raphanus sativus]
MRRSARRSSKVGDDGGDVEDPTKFRRRPGKELFSFSPLYSDLLPPATLFQSKDGSRLRADAASGDSRQHKEQTQQDLSPHGGSQEVTSSAGSRVLINVEETLLEATEMPEIPSSIPFLPNVTLKTLKQLYLTSVALISGIIFFGGLIAPKLELKVGLGGTSY